MSQDYFFVFLGLHIECIAWPFNAIGMIITMSFTKICKVALCDFVHALFDILFTILIYRYIYISALLFRK